MQIDPSKTYLHHLRDKASISPDRPWMHEVGGRSISLGEGYAESLKWADLLRGAGLEGGSRVATMLHNGIDGQMAWLGACWLKAIEIPLSPLLIGDSLVQMLNSCKATAIVTDAVQLEKVVAVADRLDHLRTVICIGRHRLAMPKTWRFIDRDTGLAAATADNAYPVPEPHETACVMFTSGTTGPSKGALIAWAQIDASLMWTQMADWDDSAVLYYTGASNHAGARAMPIAAVLLGGQIVLRSGFKTDAFWSDVDRYGCTFTSLMGAMAHFLMSAPERPDDAGHSLRWVSMIPVLPNIDAFCARFGVQCTTAYGMTELGSPIDVPGWTIDDPSVCGRIRQGWPGYQLRIVDAHDREVPSGTSGELIARTDAPWAICTAYLDRTDATAEAWRNGWFHTGDIFIRDAEGNFRYIDRLKDAIRRSGENISSMEIEAHIRAFPAILDCAAVGVRAESIEEEIKAYLVLRDGAVFEPRALIDHLAARVPKYMIPRYLSVVDDLPRTPTMRVKKNELRTQQDSAWDRLAS